MSFVNMFYSGRTRQALSERMCVIMEKNQMEKMYREMHQSMINNFEQQGWNAMNYQFLCFINRHKEEFLDYYKEQQDGTLTRFVPQSQECNGYDLYIDEKYD